jgi:hypothetical protein
VIFTKLLSAKSARSMVILTTLPAVNSAWCVVVRYEKVAAFGSILTS